MNRTLLLSTGALILSAGLAAADAFTDKIVADLQGKGFDFIEIKRGITQVKVEAIRGTNKLEVVYDLASGKIIKQEFEAAEADEIGRTDVEIDVRNRDFVDAEDEVEDEEDEEDDHGGNSGSGGGGDDEEDDEEDDHGGNSGSGGGGDDEEDDEEDDHGGNSGSGGGNSDD